MKIRSAVVLSLCTLLASTSAWAQTGAPKAGLSAADLKTINDGSLAFSKAVLAKDWAAMSALYTEDGLLCPPNEPSVKGRAAIKAWAGKFPPLSAFVLKNEKVEGALDLAYVSGTFTMTIAPPGAPPVKDSGKYLEIRKRQADGKWLMTIDIFNSDLPAPPAPPTPATPAPAKK
jgi:ketosteroid isomerase-like protein